jgi:hypothetical protein
MAKKPEGSWPDKLDQFLIEYAKLGAHVANTCAAVGVSRQTYYNWREKFPSFGENCDQILSRCIDNVEQALYKSALEGSVTAQTFYLKCKGGWNEKIAPNVNFNLDAKELSKKTDVDIMSDIQAILKREGLTLADFDASANSEATGSKN